MKKVPLILSGIFLLTISIVVITTIKLQHKEEPGGKFTNMVNAVYVGSLECKKCHERKYLEWTTTLHSKMMQNPRINPMVIIGDFDSPSSIRSFGREVVDITLGSQWKQMYLRKKGDDYTVLPAQYNILAGKWERHDYSESKEVSWFKECAGCHASGVNPDRRTYQEQGVGCEACHGPGSNHVKALPGYEIATVNNPRRMTTYAASQICGSCHTRGKDLEGKYPYPAGYMTSRGIANLRLYFNHASKEENPDMFWPSGDSKLGYMQYIDWQQSEHAKAGVSCTSCHTIHVSTSTFQTKFIGDKLCKSCHSTMGNKYAHGIHTFGSCIACHMPRTGKSAEAGDRRSHTFNFISPELSIKMGGVDKQPNSCSGCHSHKDTPLEDLVEFLDAARKVDVPKPFSSHRRVREGAR